MTKQSGRRQRRLAVVAASAFVVAGLYGGPAEAAAPAPGEVSFTSSPSLFPKFGPQINDYVVRCRNGPVTVQGHTTGGWEAAIGDHPLRSGDFSEVVPLGAGRAFRILVREVGSPGIYYRYYVRCLPNSFPNYTFTRYAPVSPRFFSADRSFTRWALRYGIIFDNHGVPVWWVRTPAWAIRVLSKGNILWWGNGWGTHGLNGSLVRALYGVGPQWLDGHDLQLLGNGNHLVGAYVTQKHVDTSAWGGSRDATVVNTLLQEVGPQGELFWAWKSQNHIGRAETGRHWPRAMDPNPYGGYDILHWNSIEPAGNSVIASFRHLDAVYKINKSTRRIVWKLGGTHTPQSLEVRNDPRAYTLGAQHDARLLPDGTLTVFDNRTYLPDKQPRAVRFRIDQQSGTATLLQSITDPAVSGSGCCGSARRLANGNWLINWGGPSNWIGGYKPNGQRTFSLKMHASYRAEPVPAGVLSAQDLRQGMNAMYGGP